MRKVELLSPVGNMEMALYAIHNGADAIYLAGVNFGARKYAKNFSDEELVNVIEYAHIYGVRVYVTVNILIYEEEIDKCLNYIKFLYLHGVDALIMQDIGLISVVRKIIPDLEIHASTQFHNYSREVLAFLKNMGVSRVVLARELSLDDIRNIDVDIEKEVFVYGALCVSYSGCCYFSSMNGGRSGNRGECVGSCRLPYKLICNNKYINTEGNYLLSTKELNTTSHIKELIVSGIASFKIEGRMKSPYYVGYVTRVYRELIDNYYNNKKCDVSSEQINNLRKLFNREFTDGYLFNNRDIVNIKSPNHVGIILGEVIEVNRDKIYIKLFEDINQEDGIRFKNSDKGLIVNKLYNEKGLLVNHVNKNKICIIDNKINLKNKDKVLKTIDSKLVSELSTYKEKKIDIRFYIKCNIGKEIELIVRDDTNKISVKYGYVDSAIKREISDDDIRRCLSKLGNTPFRLVDIDIEKDSNIFINLRDLNEIRRIAIDRLIDKRKNSKRECFINNYSYKNDYIGDNKINICVLVRNYEQLRVCIDNNIDYIYVTDYELYNKYKYLDNIYYRVERVNNNYLELDGERLLVGDIGSLNKYKDNNRLRGDYYLNITNHLSILFLSKYLDSITLSIELDKDKVKDIVDNYKYNMELVVYGRVELMIMKYCPLKKIMNYCDKCRKSNDRFCLEDRYGNRYPLIRNNCVTHIMHYKVLDKIDDIDDYVSYGINNYRIELFDEDKDEVINIINRVKNRLT